MSVVGALGAAAPPAPGALGANGVIVFQPESGERIQLFTVGADGRGRRRLTSDGAHVFPSWSPDGRSLAFVRSRWQEGERIVILEVESGEERTLAARGDDFGPLRWSPDGGRVAYQSAIMFGSMGYPDWTCSVLRVVDSSGADASAETQIGATGEWGHWGWSPDGRRLVYWTPAYCDGPRNRGGLTVFDLGTHRRSFLGARHSPAWSPRGGRIAFVRGNEIHVMAADGSGRRRLVRGSQPAWSPDGGKLAFLRCGRWSCAVFVARADGSHPRALPGSRASETPVWSPDGTKLLWQGGRRIYVARADGRGRILQLSVGDRADWQRRPGTR